MVSEPGSGPALPLSPVPAPQLSCDPFLTCFKGATEMMCVTGLCKVLTNPPMESHSDILKGLMVLQAKDCLGL